MSMRRWVPLVAGLVTSVQVAPAGGQVLKGSDRLNQVIDELILACPGAAVLDFQGGGSSSGENAMSHGLQQVAPMTRFLAQTVQVCDFIPDSTNAEGILFAREKTAVLLSDQHRAACDPDSEASCEAPKGLKKFSCPVLGTNSDWKHILRLIYFGLNCSDGSAPRNITGVRNCLDADRVALVNNWGNLFENPGAECQTGGGGASLSAGNCTQLRHAFRRDDGSAASNALREVLSIEINSRGFDGYPYCNEYPGLPAVGVSCTVTASCGLDSTCVAGMCTQVPPASGCGDGALQASEECDDGNGVSFDGCSSRCLKESATAACSTDLIKVPDFGAPGRASPYVDAYQDSDPVRRPCAGTYNVALGASDVSTEHAEEVCGRDGTLGVVLPVSVPRSLVGVAPTDLAANLYPTSYCRRGTFGNGSAPLIRAGLGSSRRYGLCPDGRLPRYTKWIEAENWAAPVGACVAGGCTTNAQCGAGGSCQLGSCASGGCTDDTQCGTSGTCNASAAVSCPVPTTSTGDKRCLNGRNNVPAAAASSFPTLGCALPPAQIDGRVFNLHLRTATGGYARARYAGLDREVLGAFHRIHSTRVLLGSGAALASDGTCPGGKCCTHSDPTLQVGCLTAASSCSMGVASVAAALSGVQPSVGSLQAAHAFSLGSQSASEALGCSGFPTLRYAYFTTLKGFENVTGAELALAKCVSGNGLPSPFEEFLARAELLSPLGGPTCLDFEGCGDPVGNACANNPEGIAP
jgi:cysteine-rich repeat protein